MARAGTADVHLVERHAAAEEVLGGFDRFLAGLGRLLYALPFIVFGSFHLLNTEQIARNVPEVAPGEPRIWAWITGAGLIAAGLAMLFRRLVELAGICLGFLLLSFVLTIHLPNLLAGGAGQQAAMTSLLKDTALAGAAFYVAAVGHRAHRRHERVRAAPAP